MGSPIQNINAEKIAGNLTAGTFSNGVHTIGSGVKTNLTGHTQFSAVTILNATGGATVGSETTPRYVTVQGSIADNNNYPAIILKGGTLVTTYPMISLSNGGYSLQNYGGLNSSTRLLTGIDSANGFYVAKVVGAGTTYPLFVDSSGNMILNAAASTLASASAKVHLVSTTEQFRVAYDTSNYITTTVASDGSVLFGGSGTGAGIIQMSVTKTTGTYFRATNTGSGTAAYAGFMASNNTSNALLQKLGTSYTTSGMFSANTFVIDNTGHLALNATTFASVKFGLNNIEYGKLSGGTWTFNSMAGSTDRVVQADSNGTISAISEIIEQWLSTGTTATTNLETTSNWLAGIYTGTTLTGTYKGQTHYDSTYFYVATTDNSWIRMARV